MPAPLTARARDEIQLELECGMDDDGIAARFGISTRQARKMRRNLRFFGIVRPNPKEFSRQGRPPALTVEMEEAVVEFLVENKQAYQDEVAEFLLEEFDTVVSCPTIYRVLKHLYITIKKVSREA